MLITGTEQQHVANDYHKKLDQAQSLSSSVILDGTSQTFCKYLNISICDTLNTKETEIPFDTNFDLYVYNPLGRNASFYVKFPLHSSNWMVLGPVSEYITGITSQISLVSDPVKAIPGR